MKQFVLQYMASECARSERIKKFRDDSPHADLRIELDNGKILAIYVINRAIRIPEIKERLEANTKKNLHTLFVIDGRMMPADNTQLEPPHWMSALHALGGGLVYGYWCEGRAVSIRPIHMDWKWGKSPRKVEYGPEIDINKLRGELTYAASKWMEGYFKIADFGDANFWKKQAPINEHTYRYSWRQWTQSRGTQENNTHEDTSETWNSWEDFERYYAEAEAEDPNFWQSTSQQHAQSNKSSSSSSSREKTRTRVTIKSNPYTVLGVTIHATEEEIKQAYRRKAREYHPDMHPQEKEKYTAKMADINAAFDMLRKRK